MFLPTQKTATERILLSSANIAASSFLIDVFFGSLGESSFPLILLLLPIPPVLGVWQHRPKAKGVSFVRTQHIWLGKEEAEEEVCLCV